MSGKPIDAEDIAVLLRLQAALPNVGLNGWFEGVRVLARVIEHLTAAQQQGQAQGGGEVVAHGFYDPATGAYSETQRTPRWLPAVVCTAPPSAPVGVEAIAAEIRASLGRGATVCTRRRWAIELEALAQQPAAEAKGQAVAECHCATCTCAPGMTPAVRFDTSPAAQEGAVRDHLIALGWTPPGAQQPAAVDEADTLLRDLVEALDAAFISSWQSTAAWQKQLDAAQHQEPTT